ncbi:hypothetical protein FQR65_LT11729 [Abscondita terminalis]|nr:hypothetical protein FQR65_LT11729 [Abscondita terminalis]
MNDITRKKDVKQLKRTHCFHTKLEIERRNYQTIKETRCLLSTIAMKLVQQAKNEIGASETKCGNRSCYQ